MGRLMMSLQLAEQNDSPTPEQVLEQALEDCVPPPPVAKWSASNAFDPDSDEFWNQESVVYEAFVDEGTTSRRTMLEEEAHRLIASGNESRRRRRDQWTESYELMDRVVTPLPDLWEIAHLNRNNGDHEGGPLETEPGQSLEPPTLVTSDRLGEIDIVVPRYTPEDTDDEDDERPPSSRPLVAGNPSPGFPMATISVEMISDVAHRTASPMPYVTYGNVHVYTPSVHHPTRTRLRRRESQPTPASISLMS